MDKIQKFLLEIGMPSNLKGFNYLHDAIQQGMENKSFQSKIMKIYSDIAQDYKVKPVAVERCMRTAIEKTFMDGNMGKIIESFFFFNNKKGKLTNKDFIVRSVLYLSGE